ncbi:MAG TPA: hypothetical protein VL442_17710 [Mucilaginibacter sp.]|nr:hypothetical protein [Mucilaginibacter sp.]
MKAKPILLLIAILFISFAGTKQSSAQQRNAAVTISDSNTILSFKARYDPVKTSRIQQCMTDALKETGYSFKNTQLDAQLTLTGGINFYIKSDKGELVLKFDKRKNNTADYTKFKKMCEDIKAIVQEN